MPAAACGACSRGAKRCRKQDCSHPAWGAQRQAALCKQKNTRHHVINRLLCAQPRLQTLREAAHAAGMGTGGVGATGMGTNWDGTTGMGAAGPADPGISCGPGLFWMEKEQHKPACREESFEQSLPWEKKMYFKHFLCLEPVGTW